MAIIVLVIFFMGHDWIPEVLRYSFYYWIPMGLVIFAFAFQGGFISKILSLPIFVLLGEISFGFYMFHYLVLDYFEILNNKSFHIQNDYLSIGIIFTVTIVLSYISFFKFEKPINSYIKKVL